LAAYWRPTTRVLTHPFSTLALWYAFALHPAGIAYFATRQYLGFYLSAIVHWRVSDYLFETPIGTRFRDAWHHVVGRHYSFYGGNWLVLDYALHLTLRGFLALFRCFGSVLTFSPYFIWLFRRFPFGVGFYAVSLLFNLLLGITTSWCFPVGPLAAYRENNFWSLLYWMAVCVVMAWDPSISPIIVHFVIAAIIRDVRLRNDTKPDPQSGRRLPHRPLTLDDEASDSPLLYGPDNLRPLLLRLQEGYRTVPHLSFMDPTTHHNGCPVLFHPHAPSYVIPSDFYPLLSPMERFELYAEFCDLFDSRFSSLYDPDSSPYDRWVSQRFRTFQEDWPLWRLVCMTGLVEPPIRGGFWTFTVDSPSPTSPPGWFLDDPPRDPVGPTVANDSVLASILTEALARFHRHQDPSPSPEAYFGSWFSRVRQGDRDALLHLALLALASFLACIVSWILYHFPDGATGAAIGVTLLRGLRAMQRRQAIPSPEGRGSTRASRNSGLIQRSTDRTTWADDDDDDDGAAERIRALEALSRRKALVAPKRAAPAPGPKITKQRRVPDDYPGNASIGLGWVDELELFHEWGKMRSENFSHVYGSNGVSRAVYIPTPTEWRGGPTAWREWLTKQVAAGVWRPGQDMVSLLPAARALATLWRHESETIEKTTGPVATLATVSPDFSRLEERGPLTTLGGRSPLHTRWLRLIPFSPSEVEVRNLLDDCVSSGVPRFPVVNGPLDVRMAGPVEDRHVPWAVTIRKMKGNPVMLKYLPCPTISSRVVGPCLLLGAETDTGWYNWWDEKFYIPRLADLLLVPALAREFAHPGGAEAACCALRLYLAAQVGFTLWREPVSAQSVDDAIALTARVGPALGFGGVEPLRSPADWDRMTDETVYAIRDWLELREVASVSDRAFAHIRSSVIRLIKGRAFGSRAARKEVLDAATLSRVSHYRADKTLGIETRVDRQLADTYVPKRDRAGARRDRYDPEATDFEPFPEVGEGTGLFDPPTGPGLFEWPDEAPPVAAPMPDSAGLVASFMSLLTGRLPSVADLTNAWTSLRGVAADLGAVLPAGLKWLAGVVTGSLSSFLGAARAFVAIYQRRVVDADDKLWAECDGTRYCFSRVGGDDEAVLIDGRRVPISELAAVFSGPSEPVGDDDDEARWRARFCVHAADGHTLMRPVGFGSPTPQGASSVALSFRILRDLVWFAQLGSKAFGWAADQVAGFFGYEAKFTVAATSESLTRLVTSVEELVGRRDAEVATLPTLRRLRDKLWDSIQRLDSLERPRRSPLSQRAMTVFNRVVDRITHMQRVPDKTQSRMEPAGVFLYGPPGTGKDVAAVQLCALLPGPGGGSAAVFQRNSDTEHMDGYQGNENVIMYSDAFQDTLQESTTACALEMIHLGSSENFPGKFAELDNKGAYLMPDWIMATANDPLDRIRTHLRDPAALKRRIHLELEVQRSSEGPSVFTVRKWTLHTVEKRALGSVVTLAEVAAALIADRQYRIAFRDRVNIPHIPAPVGLFHPETVPMGVTNFVGAALTPANPEPEGYLGLIAGTGLGAAGLYLLERYGPAGLDYLRDRFSPTEVLADALVRALQRVAAGIVAAPLAGAIQLWDALCDLGRVASRLARAAADRPAAFLRSHAGAVAGAIAVVFGAVAVYRPSPGPTPQNAHMGSGGRTHYAVKRHNRVVRAGVRMARPPTPQVGSPGPVRTDESLRDHVVEFRIRQVGGSGTQATCVGLAVVSDVFLVTGHCFRDRATGVLMEDALVELAYRRGGVKGLYHFRLADALLTTQQGGDADDVASIQLPPRHQVPYFKSVLSRFNDDQHAFAVPTTCSALAWRGDFDLDRVRYVADQSYGPHHAAHAIQSTLWSVPGDCGTPLVRDGYVIGLHVAGGPSGSYAVLLSRSFVEGVLPEPSQEGGPHPNAPHLPTMLSPFGPHSSFGMTSKLVKTVVHQELWDSGEVGKVPSLGRPVLLADSIRSDFVDGGYAPDELSYARECWSLVFQDLGAPRCEPLSLSEAVATLDLDKSAGMPWIGRGFRTKGDCVDDAGQLRPVVERAVYDHLARADTGVISSGDVPDAVATDKAKDETRRAGKHTRLIGMISVCLHLAMVIAFGGFRQILLSSRDKLPSVVGINPFGPEWGSAWGRFSNSGRVADGDIKGQEFCVWNDDIILFGWFASLFYAPDYGPRCHRLMGVLCNMWHVFSGFMYRAQGGHPSGHFLTVELNTFALTTRYWLCLRRLIPGLSPRDAIRWALMVYGDDSVCSLDGIGTFALLCEHMAHFGFTMAAANKDMRGVRDYVPPRDQLTLLKRYVVIGERGAILAPLERESILTSVAYSLRDDRTGEKYMARAISAVREAALHGPLFYSRVVAYVCRVIDAAGTGYTLAGHPFAFPSYDVARARLVEGAIVGCSVDDDVFFS